MEEIGAYLKRQDFLSVTNGILLSDEELKRRYVIRHLLIYPGIPRRIYRNRFGREVTEDFPILKEWTEQGWVEDKGVFLCFTQEGLGLSDYIGPMLISGDVKERMLEWERIYGKENDFIQGEPEKL